MKIDKGIFVYHTIKDRAAKLASKNQTGAVIGGLVGNEIVGHFVNEFDENGQFDAQHFAHQIVGTVFSLVHLGRADNPNLEVMKSAITVSATNPAARRLAKGIFDVVTGDYNPEWDDVQT